MKDLLFPVQIQVLSSESWKRLSLQVQLVCEFLLYALWKTTNGYSSQAAQSHPTPLQGDSGVLAHERLDVLKSLRVTLKE